MFSIQCLSTVLFSINEFFESREILAEPRSLGEPRILAEKRVLSNKEWNAGAGCRAFGPER